MEIKMAPLSVNIRYSYAFALSVVCYIRTATMESQDQLYKRKNNWEKEEVQVLVQAVADNRDILTGKLSLSVTAERKAKTWEAVLTRVNAVSRTNRSIKETKKKWQSFQSTVKAKESERRKVVAGTGGGPGPKDLSEVEKSALTIIPKSMLNGIDAGLESGIHESTQNPCSCTGPSMPASVSSLVNGSGDEDSTVNIASTSWHKTKNPEKRKCSNFVKSDEDFQSKLLKIEQRKLEIKEQRLIVEKEKTEAIKQIAFVLQANQLENLLQ